MLKPPDRSEIQARLLLRVGAVFLVAIGAGGLALFGAGLAGLLCVFGASLLLGWLLAATVLTRLTARGVVFEAPEWPDQPRETSPFRVTGRIGNANPRMPNLHLQVGFRVQTREGWVELPPHRVRCLPSGEITEVSWELSVQRRGTVMVDSVLVTAAFPGSLTQVVHTFDAPVKYQKRHVQIAAGGWMTSLHFRRARIVVLPALTVLHPWAMELLKGRRARSAKSHPNPAAMEEFVGVRLYRAGDNPRNVHWGLSARLAYFPKDLVVREFEDPFEQDVCIILDTSSGKGAAQLDQSLSFALGLARVLLESQHRVRFLARNGRQEMIDRRLGSERSGLHRLESEVADLEATPSRGDSMRLLREVSYRERATLFWVCQEESTSPLPASVIAVGPGMQKQLALKKAGR